MNFMIVKTLENFIGYPLPTEVVVTLLTCPHCYKVEGLREALGYLVQHKALHHDPFPLIIPYEDQKKLKESLALIATSLSAPFEKLESGVPKKAVQAVMEALYFATFPITAEHLIAPFPLSLETPSPINETFHPIQGTHFKLYGNWHTEPIKKRDIQVYSFSVLAPDFTTYSGRAELDLEVRDFDSNPSFFSDFLTTLKQIATHIFVTMTPLLHVKWIQQTYFNFSSFIRTLKKIGKHYVRTIKKLVTSLLIFLDS